MKVLGKNPNWGAIAAVLALVAIGVYDFVVPKASVDANTKTLKELTKDRRVKEEEHGQTREKVDSLTWQVGRDEIGPRAMAWVSRAASANFVTVSAFRPQRTTEAGSLDQLNYMVTAEGSFLNVMRLIDALESPDSLMAVRSVQVASMNGASDTVRATLGLVAFKEVQANGS